MDSKATRDMPMSRMPKGHGCNICEKGQLFKSMCMCKMTGFDAPANITKKPAVRACEICACLACDARVAGFVWFPNQIVHF